MMATRLTSTSRPDLTGQETALTAVLTALTAAANSITVVSNNALTALGSSTNSSM